MGFHVKWINIMMSCVCSVSYSIRIDGKPCDHITPTQGLCLGNPLSPYLFFICAEGLFALLTKFVEDGLLKGVEACLRGPTISHLFFAYDSLIFCRATREDCTSLENILETYEHVFGQQLNSIRLLCFLVVIRHKTFRMI